MLDAFSARRVLLGNAVFMRYTLAVTLFYVSAYGFITARRTA